ncbi:uncharacterized protein DNG_06489 [Cephalotrichum gorgonifer]|uniref:C2H2-type domain-containing protein n=1 Tax=Cephalotrichum gorgonifer TaxID=2041049 RepID=A0AAE8MZW4_9PEZI|nr:uncharacterized protein DNG_06489 [Cephalotrichum gorgonifer]
MCGPTRPEAVESGDAGNSQKLPGFAAFLSFSALDEARTGVAPGMPTSPSLAGPSKLSPNPYAGMTMHGSARDQFRNWFSDPGVDRIPAPLISGRRASETPVIKLPADSNNEELRPTVLEPQVQLEQRGQPWRPSLSSTALLAPREGSAADRGQHLWRRASMGNMLTGNSAYPPTLVPRPPSASATGSRSLDTDCQAAAPTYKPGPAFSVPALTVPAPLGHQPMKLPAPAPERVKSTLNRLLQPAPGAPERAPDQQAPSPLPESTARPSVPMIASSSWDPAGEKSSTTTKTNDRKRKASDAVSADGKGSPPAESERKRFKCPVQGCNSSYTWKENLTRHKTTRHAPVVRYCPFCKVNAVRLSFNRTDNFQGHILRHFRGRENSRARTEFDPAAEAFYRGITDMARREKQGQVKVRGGRGTAMMGSPRSEASDDTVEVPDELCIREYS